MNENEDRMLIETVLAGDPQAFLPFIQKYKRLVGHIVGRMVHNQADREDVGQDIFVKIFRNLASFQFRSKLSTWVARIAYNTCVHYLQKKRLPLLADEDSHEGDPFALLASETPDPSQWLEEQEMTLAVREAVRSLAPVYATVLTLYHLEDMKYQEIAEIMGIPEGTVKSYLFRGRKLVLRRLTASYQEVAL